MDYRRSLGQPLSEIDPYVLEAVLNESVPMITYPADISVLIRDAEKKPELFMDKLDPRPRSSPTHANSSLASSSSTSIFEKRKPFIPFSSKVEQYPTLQKRIPLPFLPKKLVVHDPWGLLFVVRDRKADPPIPSLSPDPGNEIPEGLKNVPKDTDTKTPWMQKPDIVHVYKLDLTETSNDVVRNHWDFFNKTPHKKQGVTSIGGEPVPEAHLYITPDKKIGTGHHSFVYNAMWELPRSSLVPQREREEGEICSECLKRVLETAMNGDVRPEISEEDGDNVINIQLDAPPTCHHPLDPDPNMPFTATCQVAAKLSFQYDDHLAREAENYQKFPKHFSEHWSGYNIIKPIRQPVPIGALVPQFYGNFPT